jgi:hypothetical protein
MILDQLCWLANAASAAVLPLSFFHQYLHTATWRLPDAAWVFVLMRESCRVGPAKKLNARPSLPAKALLSFRNLRGS